MKILEETGVEAAVQEKKVKIHGCTVPRQKKLAPCASTQVTPQQIIFWQGTLKDSEMKI
jgi:hypothetical protein